VAFESVVGVIVSVSLPMLKFSCAVTTCVLLKVVLTTVLVLVVALSGEVDVDAVGKVVVKEVVDVLDKVIVKEVVEVVAEMLVRVVVGVVVKVVVDAVVKMVVDVIVKVVADVFVNVVVETLVETVVEVSVDVLVKVVVGVFVDVIVEGAVVLVLLLVCGALQVTFMPACDLRIPCAEQAPASPPSQAREPQPSFWSPTSKRCPSGHVQMPPQEPTPGSLR